MVGCVPPPKVENAKEYADRQGCGPHDYEHRHGDLESQRRVGEHGRPEEEDDHPGPAAERYDVAELRHPAPGGARRPRPLDLLGCQERRHEQVLEEGDQCCGPWRLTAWQSQRTSSCESAWVGRPSPLASCAHLSMASTVQALLQQATRMSAMCGASSARPAVLPAGGAPGVVAGGAVGGVAGVSGDAAGAAAARRRVAAITTGCNKITDKFTFEYPSSNP